jgi:hypothetical protein
VTVYCRSTAGQEINLCQKSRVFTDSQRPLAVCSLAAAGLQSESIQSQTEKWQVSKFPGDFRNVIDLSIFEVLKSCEYDVCCLIRPASPLGMRPKSHLSI